MINNLNQSTSCSSPSTSNYTNSPRILASQHLNNQYTTNINGGKLLASTSPSSQAVQQAAAAAAASAAINAHSTTNLNVLNQQNDNQSLENQSNNIQQHYHRQQYVLSTHSPKQSSSSSSSNILSNSPKQLTSGNVNLTHQQNVNLKQQIHYQQQQHQQNAAAAAAATAAAEYFEQQLKLQQHKNLELEQQFRVNSDQIKELKEKVNSLNEINRKIYDENHQFKERSLEQRQQIEQFHALFQENQQKHEKSLMDLRKERDEAFQHDSEIMKRRMHQTFESRQQENFLIMQSLKEKLEATKASESRLLEDMTSVKQEVQSEKNKSELLEKKCKLLEKDALLLKESHKLERNELEAKFNDMLEQHEQLKKKYLSDKQKLEENFFHERSELKTQLNSLEKKLEEVIKEKAQLNCKYGQMADANRELNALVQNKEAFNSENNNKLGFYINKCNDLEKEIADTQENHLRETEEWKKFQADLQTAVRVANDFLNEAEEKMVKMKDDFAKMKEKEAQLNIEIEILKKKPTSNNEVIKTQTAGNNGYQKQNKENQQLNTSPAVVLSATNTLTSSQSQTSLVRNLIDTIESNSNVVLTPLQLNSSNETNSTNMAATKGLNNNNKIRYSTSSVCVLNGNHHLINSSTTDTDDAKIISSRVRSNSSTQENTVTKNLTSSSSSSSSLAQNFYNNVSTNGSNNKSHSIYSTLPFNRTSNKTSNNKANIDWNNSAQANFHNNSDALANLVKQYGVSKRNALMKWCQERMFNYKNIEIKNFSSSWNDGLAFCALIHSFLPDKIDYESLKNENNPCKNFQTAFKVAQSIGIEQTLNMNELLNHERPDWNAVMNYVTSIYKHFQLQQQQPTQNEVEIVSSISSSSSASTKSSRSSSSSPPSHRNYPTVQASSAGTITLPLSLSNSTTSSSSNSNYGSGTFISASSSSSSISKTLI